MRGSGTLALPGARAALPAAAQEAMAWLAPLRRYDHYSVLCELLPVGIPSLAVCLQSLVNGEPPARCRHPTSRCEWARPPSPHPAGCHCLRAPVLQAGKDTRRGVGGRGRRASSPPVLGECEARGASA